MTTATLMSAAQHRARAEQLRKDPASIAQEVARHHQLVAKLKGTASARCRSRMLCACIVGWCNGATNDEDLPMADSSIEWTDATWNPVAGCSVISPGCTNCYAMRMAARLEAMGVEKYRGLTRKSGHRARVDRQGPMRSLCSRRSEGMAQAAAYFCEFDVRPFPRRGSDRIRGAGLVGDGRDARHTYQILTKRPDRMLEVVVGRSLPVLPNVWLGTSVEDDRVLDRVDLLRRVPASIRFVSFEPLIGSVADANLAGISWAIVGGESGPARGRCIPSGSTKSRRCVDPRRQVFLQAMGWSKQEADRPTLPWSDLGRHADLEYVTCNAGGEFRRRPCLGLTLRKTARISVAPLSIGERLRRQDSWKDRL